MDHLDEYIRRAHDFNIRCLEYPEPDVSVDDKSASRTAVEIFMHYPEDHHWTLADGRIYNAQLLRQLGLEGKKDFGPEWLHAVSAMIQRWLFFELLRAFFNDDAAFNVQDFMTPDHSFISTARLNEYIDRWSNRIRQDPQHSTQRILQAQDILVKARGEVATNCAAQPGPTLESNWPVDPTVALSVIILGESLTKALQSLESEPNRHVYVPGWRYDVLRDQGWGHSTEVLQHFRRKWKIEPGGSCVNMDVLCTSFQGSTIGLLLAAADNPLFDNHGVCDHETCRAKERSRKDKELNAFIRDQKTVISSAASDGQDKKRLSQSFAQIRDHKQPELEHHRRSKGHRCDCKQHLVDPKRLESILDSGNLPLFSFEDDKLNLHDDCTFEDQFFVFSHAWLDGFGNNGEANFVFDCNLKFFNELCQRLLGQESRWTAPKFWFDALGIPENTSDRRRTEAIKQIHRIYRNAKATIVLDAGMLYRPDHEDFLQRAIRVTGSNWISRIWTLQESYLSPELYFVFGEKLININTIRGGLKHRGDSIGQQYSLAAARKFYDRTLRAKRGNLPDDLSTVNSQQLTKHVTPDFVANVYEAVQLRNQGSARDETEALAILFNLNGFFDDRTAGKFRGQGELFEQRMQLLVHWLCSNTGTCAIPAGFVFLEGKKLPMPGYRWAPSTWLNSQELLTPNPLQVIGDDTRLLDRGLEVKLPGLTLRPMGARDAMIGQFKRLVVMSTSGIQEWYHIQPAKEGDQFPTKDMIKQRSLAIVTMSSSVVQPVEVALLVAIDSEESATFFVEILTRIQMRREHQLDEMRDLSRLLHRPDKSLYPRSFMCGHAVGPDQKWCIDGMKPETAKAKHSSATTRQQLAKPPRTDTADAPKPGLKKAATIGNRALNRIGTFIGFDRSRRTGTALG